MIIGFSGTVLSRAGEQEPGVFDFLEPEPLEEKNQVPEPLGTKKVRSQKIKSISFYG